MRSRKLHAESGGRNADIEGGATIETRPTALLQCTVPTLDCANLR